MPANLLSELVDIVLARSLGGRAKCQLHDRILGADEPPWTQPFPNLLKIRAPLVLQRKQEDARVLLGALADLIN
eukprot:CAMPEP_0170595590 /NCGR_PEP_ID=MMETSP0224-20130122/14648_1 /TAXON_ID=285029 /ORGANISM="Togula jolla, Strain CCCM 725" /LENGTH=73 /DNA_ID=CAMNT_0010919791 /DNA_START=551 /DNA_END=772 /DNA_ORIENTATION=-